MDEFIDASSVGENHPFTDNSWWTKWPGTSTPVHLVLERTAQAARGIFSETRTRTPLKDDLPSTTTAPKQSQEVETARYWCKKGQHNRVGGSMLSSPCNSRTKPRLQRKQTVAQETDSIAEDLLLVGSRLGGGLSSAWRPRHSRSSQRQVFTPPASPPRGECRAGQWHAYFELHWNTGGTLDAVVQVVSEGPDRKSTRLNSSHT